MRLLHGRPLAEQINARSRERSEKLRARGITPVLAVVSVGADPAANTYLHRLERAGRHLGISVTSRGLARDAGEQDVIGTLEKLAADRAVNAILLLTPLPGALDEGHLVDHIAPEKDVEGVHPFNVGLLADGRPRYVPSTADAAVELLRFHGIGMRGVHAVVVGRSTVIGRPLASLLLREDATVTIAHSRTVELADLTRRASIVVVSVGKAEFLTGEMVRPGAIVVDAGINVTPAGITGDVDVESVAAVAGALSPVPGGLGTVTTALLLRNVFAATERQSKTS